MEANLCDVNHSDAGVLLPPRKRLLAGLKKQNSDNECTSHASVFPSSSSSSSSPSSVFNTSLNTLMSSHASNSDLSPEEIVEASKSAAEKAAAVAKAARAAAEEKAEIAARAVAAAKSALDLVASFSEEIGNSDSYLKKNNKLKKHVPVNSLYKKYKSVENCKADEELARTLHRAINSSPRISKNPSSSGSKAHKNKKPKILSEQYEARVFGNGHSIVGDKAGAEESSGEKNTVELGKKEAKYDHLDMENGESSQLKEKWQEDVSTTSTSGKKRGRVKLKKLPLSICTIKDIATPKDETSSRASEDRTGNGSKSLSIIDHSGENLPAPVWKCQEFQAPSCVKQNKVAQL